MTRVRRLATGPSGLIAVAVLAVAAFPQLVPNTYYLFLAATVALYVLVGTGMNVLAGFTGQYSMAQGALVALGAYTAGNLTVLHGWPLWEALVPAMALPAAVAALLSIPSLRLSRWYFAMITVLIASIVQQFILQAGDLTGGGGGLAPIPQIAFGDTPLDPVTLFYFLAAVDALALLATWNLLRSPWGRAMMAVRDDELAAQACGVSVAMVKLLAFVISALAAGLMGAFYAALTGAIAPDLFSLDLGIFILLMIVVGGAGLIEGPILGALTLFAVPSLLFTLARYRLFVYAGVLLLIMAFAPAGIGGALRTLMAWLRSRISPPRSKERMPAAQPATIVLEPIAGQPVSVHGLVRSFGGVRALDDVSLDVPAGTVHGVIGPNGSGKTTLLNTISGFYPPEAGSVTLRDRNLTGWSPHRVARAGVARTFQQPKVLGAETALVNVLLGAFPRRRASIVEWILRVGRARSEDRKQRGRAMELLAFVGLSSEADTRANLLPHGRQRLLEIARALASRPSVLLLDEPAAGLAPDEVERLESIIHSLRGAGLTVVVVEHNIEFISRVADRLTVMNVGRVLTESGPAEALREPAVIEAYLGAAVGAV